MVVSNYGLGSCIAMLNTKNQIMSVTVQELAIAMLLQMNDKLILYGDSHG